MTHLKFTPPELKRMCLANPAALCLSLENNLKPKIHHWACDMKLDVDEVKEFILGHPKQLTTQELDPKMRRRIKVLKNINGRGVSLVHVPLSILSGSEYIFKKWYV